MYFNFGKEKEIEEINNNVINVKSEIGPLKKVLLHRPGAELLNLTPDTLSRLLFDDIPFLPDAQAEHDEFAGILRDKVDSLISNNNIAQFNLFINKSFIEFFCFVML